MAFWVTLIASMITGGLAGALVRYVLDKRREQIAYTMKLHEQWWSEEFQRMRRAVFELVSDFSAAGGPGEKSLEFLAQFQHEGRFEHPAGPAFVRIVFFFSDLNACLDKKVVDKRLAYRLFGESQYFWFEPLIDAVRDKVKRNPQVRWAWEINSLSSKFTKIKERDERRHAKQLLK